MNLLAFALLQSLSFGGGAPLPAPAIALAPRGAAVEAVVVAPAPDAQTQLGTGASVATTAGEYPGAWRRVFEGRATGKYYGARYYSSAQGRFTTPDASFADQKATDPQSWNLYPYARNNPLKYVDPDGRVIVNAALAFGGAAAGGLAGVIGYFGAQHVSGRATNVRDAIAAGLGGAASGFLAGLTLGASLPVEGGIALAVTGTAATTATLVGSNVVGGAVSRELDSSATTTALGSGKAVAVDAAAGLLGPLAGKVVSAPLAGAAGRLRTAGGALLLDGQADLGRGYLRGAADAASRGAAQDAVVGNAVSNVVVPVLVAVSEKDKKKEEKD